MGFYTPTEAATIQKLAAQRESLRGYFKERDDPVEAMFVALLGQQHVVMIGPPGTGKSYLITCFAKGIANFNVFDWQLTKFSTPEELFGPYSLKGLKEGRYERIPDNTLQTCDFAYLDEIFNSNSSVLNALNGAMNERVLERKHIPLQCLFSGTNFVPEEPVLVAFFDRFLFRFVIEEIAEADHFQEMLQAGNYQLDPTVIITKPDLTALQRKVELVGCDRIVPLITKLWEKLKDEGMYPSSRRFKWAMKGLKALALLNGRKEVIDEDLFLLKHVLWTEKKEMPVLEQTIAKLVAPAMAKIKDLVTQAKELEDAIRDADPKKSDQLGLIMETLEKLKLLAHDIEEVGKRSANPRIETLATKCAGDVRDRGKQIQKTKLPFAF